MTLPIYVLAGLIAFFFFLKEIEPGTPPFAAALLALFPTIIALFLVRLLVLFSSNLALRLLETP